MVGRMVRLAKFLDREIVDADQFHSLFYQPPRSVKIEISKIRVKLWIGLTPERRIASFEKYSRSSLGEMRLHKLFIDRERVFGSFDHFSFTDQHVKRKRLNLRGAFDEMRRSINVGCRVCTEIQR